MNDLTGKQRFRIWRSKIILQVQYSFLHTINAGAVVDCERCFVWRDATLEDVSEFHGPIPLDIIKK